MPGRNYDNVDFYARPIVAPPGDGVYRREARQALRCVFSNVYVSDIDFTFAVRSSFSLGYKELATSVREGKVQCLVSRRKQHCVCTAPLLRAEIEFCVALIRGPSCSMPLTLATGAARRRRQSTILHRR